MAGRDLLDGASAAYALAPEHERNNLRVAAENLRTLEVPLDPDRKQTLQQIDWMHREDLGVVLEQTPEFTAWIKWKTCLDVAVSKFKWLLWNGDVRAFGEPDRPHSPSHWIDPMLWQRQGLVADPGMPGKFSGHGLVFWNVRVVDAFEVIAEDKAQESQSKKATESAVRRSPPSLAKLTEWYKSRCDAWKAGMPVPSSADDLRDAKAEFGQENRDRLKVLRHDLAPAAWNVGTPGRKKKAQ